MICASFPRVRRVLRDLIIISHLFEFVKGFSKSFLKNFFHSLPSRFAVPVNLSQKCPTIISHPNRFVKGFCKSFFNFFAIFLSVLSARHLRAARFQPAYYITSFPFCQEVFSIFFDFGVHSILS